MAKRKFNLEDYDTVENRLKDYQEDNPDCRVLTDILKYTPDNVVVIRATLYRNAEDQKLGLFHTTGIAEETTEGFINETSRVENCETSAIGRALANANYTGKGGRPSRTEMEKVQRLTEARKEKPHTKKEVIEPEVETADEYIEKINSFDDSSELVEWFTETMNKEGEGFKDKYFEHAQRRLEQLD